MDINTLTERYFAASPDTPLQALLDPIPGTYAAGEPLAASQVYAAIRSAREEDDESLPLGAWEHELKRADWGSVSRLCRSALATRSKDLQIAVWLLESEIQKRGFESLAPCLNLIAMLSKTYWSGLYPLDTEHRVNLYRWLADKLRLPLRRRPFTATGNIDFGWADWEQAQRNEQLRAALGKDAAQAIEGATLQQFTAALASTPSAAIVTVQSQIAAAQAALATLDAVLRPLLNDEAPSLEALRELLEDIELMLAGEAKRRGLISVSAAATAETGETIESDVAPGSGGLGEEDRSRLYQILAITADELARLEPHSPVPYLIRRAVAWGGLNTAQLYGEVFVRCGGQINIFELLGLEAQIDQSEQNAA